VLESCPPVFSFGERRAFSTVLVPYPAFLKSKSTQMCNPVDVSFLVAQEGMSREA
jgi:hypothetical protein